MSLQRLSLLDLGPSKHRVSNLAGSDNFFESSLIVWDSATSKVIPSKPTPAHIERVELRLRDLARWVEQGNTLVVILRGSLAEISYQTKTSRGSLGHDTFRLRHAKLFTDISLSESSGSIVEYCGPKSGQSIFRDWLSAIRYKAIVSGDQLRPLLRVVKHGEGEQQTVCAYKGFGAGTIFYVPSIADETQLEEYVDAVLVRLPEILFPSPTELPSWVGRFQTEAEAIAYSKIDELKSQADSIARAIADQQSIADDVSALKELFVGSGEALKNTVAAAFRELGLRVIDGPNSRADLLAFDGDKLLAAIEVKGLDGSAKEADVRQAVQWTAEVNATMAIDDEQRKADPEYRRYEELLRNLGVKMPPSENQVECKGIMVIGAYRRTALDLRNEPDFPDPVARLAKKSNVCALSGLQLFGLTMRARTQPELKTTILKKLFGSDGPFSAPASYSGIFSVYYEENAPTEDSENREI